jgi:O-methyltransferase
VGSPRIRRYKTYACFAAPELESENCCHWRSWLYPKGFGAETVTMKNALRSLVRKAGYEVMNLKETAKSTSLPCDFTAEESTLYARVRPFTVTSPERIVSLVRAVQYVIDAQVPGALVECGVWKGGSAMAMAMTLQARAVDRELFLYDVFGMIPSPVSQDGNSAKEEWARYAKGESKAWTPTPTLESVTANLKNNGCSLEKIRFVQGKVEDTIPGGAPDAISLLRLDTDFYESTRHELEHLYPRLSVGGVLIIDDYTAFVGCRQAVDEYFAKHRIRAFLNRIDADSRLIIKPAPSA